MFYYFFLICIYFLFWIGILFTECSIEKLHRLSSGNKVSFHSTALGNGMPSAKQLLLAVSWVSSKRWPLNVQVFVYIHIFLCSYANCSTPLPPLYTWLSPPHHGWEKLCGEHLFVNTIIFFGFDFGKMPWVILGTPQNTPCFPHSASSKRYTLRHWLHPQSSPWLLFLPHNSWAEKGNGFFWKGVCGPSSMPSWCLARSPESQNVPSHSRQTAWRQGGSSVTGKQRLLHLPVSPVRQGPLPTRSKSASFTGPTGGPLRLRTLDHAGGHCIILPEKVAFFLPIQWCFWMLATSQVEF